MREIVHCQLGQCGNQIGNKARIFLCVFVFCVYSKFSWIIGAFEVVSNCDIENHHQRYFQNFERKLKKCKYSIIFWLCEKQITKKLLKIIKIDKLSKIC